MAEEHSICLASALGMQGPQISAQYIVGLECLGYCIGSAVLTFVWTQSARCFPNKQRSLFSLDKKVLHVTWSVKFMSVGKIIPSFLNAQLSVAFLF